MKIFSPGENSALRLSNAVMLFTSISLIIICISCSNGKGSDNKPLVLEVVPIPIAAGCKPLSHGELRVVSQKPLSFVNAS